jgi:tetratricopeptide (TPR) repeat protein
LAVIYAQQKQYEKAKQALEQAIRTHPSYATAHENLGDLYARLASQAYGKALQLDASNTSAQSKLALIKDMSSTSTARQTGKPVETAKPVTPPPSTPITAPTPTVVATAPAKPVPETIKPAEPAKPEVKAEPKAEPARPEVKPEPAKTEPKTVAAGDPSVEVSKAIEAWAAAWTRKDVKAYLARYAKDFKVPSGASRTSWETERNQRINKPGKISVDVDNIKVSVDAADQVTARFRQHYKSATLSSSTTKTLVLVKRDGKWLIVQERVGG